MTLGSARHKPQDAVPTSSMADIAFLLLIFFLVTTVFPKDFGLALALPQDEVDVSPRNVLVFEVGVDGLVGVRHGESTDVRRVSADEVARIWRTEVADNSQLIAAVRVDPDAPYARMVNVLDELQVAGAQRISLQAGRR